MKRKRAEAGEKESGLESKVHGGLGAPLRPSHRSPCSSDFSFLGDV